MSLFLVFLALFKRPYTVSLYVYLGDDGILRGSIWRSYPKQYIPIDAISDETMRSLTRSD